MIVVPFGAEVVSAVQLKRLAAAKDLLGAPQGSRAN
jgi:hypothetical protein